MVDALTAPNRPAVARASSFFTPFMRAKVNQPNNTIVMPITALNKAGNSMAPMSPPRISMPP